ncbi:MAG: DUF4832 domain-containing protein [Myxococcota bacterium]
MKKFTLCSGVLIMALSPGLDKSASAQTSPLQESLVHTRNPERGFINQDYLYPLRQVETQSMTRYLVDLSAKCNDTDVAQEALALEAALQSYRAAGKQLIVRIVYSTRDGFGNACGAGHRYEPASFAVLAAHLATIKPVLIANAESIAAWEAGILGAFGEWHGWGQELIGGTPYLLYDEGQMLQAGAGAWGYVPAASRDGRLTVLRLLLDTVPSEISILVRRPVFRFEATRAYSGVGRDFTNLLTGQTDALSDPEIGRIGFHNDCYLSSYDDYSTYSADFGALYYPEIDTTEEARGYVVSVANTVPFGGEVCWPQPSATLSCAEAVPAMEDMGLSYLNRNWYAGAIDDWITEGCFDEIEQRMGYRYVARTVATSTVVAPGSSMTVQVGVDNVGFARMLKPRNAELVLVRGGVAHRAGIELPLTSSVSTDLMSWLPGTTSTVSQTFDAPLVPGEYEVHLAMPDPVRASAFAVRLSNTLNSEDVFDEALGSNDLGVTVRVAGQCVPLSCAELGACGLVADGCGGSVDCGVCGQAMMAMASSTESTDTSLASSTMNRTASVEPALSASTVAESDAQVSVDAFTPSPGLHANFDVRVVLNEVLHDQQTNARKWRRKSVVIASSSEVTGRKSKRRRAGAGKER